MSSLYVCMCELIWPWGGNILHDSPRQDATWTLVTHIHWDSEVHLLCNILSVQAESHISCMTMSFCAACNDVTDPPNHLLTHLHFHRCLDHSQPIRRVCMSELHMGQVQHVIVGIIDGREIPNMHIRRWTVSQFHNSSQHEANALMNVLLCTLL